MYVTDSESKAIQLLWNSLLAKMRPKKTLQASDVPKSFSDSAHNLRITEWFNQSPELWLSLLRRDLTMLESISHFKCIWHLKGQFTPQDVQSQNYFLLLSTKEDILVAAINFLGFLSFSYYENQWLSSAFYCLVRKCGQKHIVWVW